VRLRVPCGERFSLLLEEILKRRPSIIGPQSRRGGSLFLARNPNLVELAIVPRILLRDPHFHWLHALKTASRIEICALLAGMQLEAAFRTVAITGDSLQHGSALRTS
jgi:hypothetical protein